MKKLFATLLLLGLAPALPAKANPTAESCLNSILTKIEAQPKGASLQVTVDHDGNQYHAIALKFDPIRPGVETDGMIYIRTNSAGACENLLSYQTASFPDENVYEEKLGREVTRKIKAAYKAQR